MNASSSSSPVSVASPQSSRARRVAGRAAIAAAALVGVALGLGAYTFDEAEGLSYLSNDPNACINCHIMNEQFDGWQHASHHAHATCNDCHVPVDFIGKYATKIEHGWRHSKGFTLQNFHEPIMITPGSRAIVEANCIRCHDGLVSDLVAHSRVPEAAQTDADCLRCHSHVGHGPRRATGIMR